MAARAKGKPKQEAKTRTAGQFGAKGGRKGALRETPAARKTPSPKASRSNTPATKAPAKRAARSQAKSKSPHSKSAATTVDTATQLLLDQNEALRAELEQANARIQHLEELNRNVLNRIDWVIDSLQGVLEAKR